MDIQKIVAKSVAGEELTAEEKAFAESWNPGNAISAARKEAETKAAEALKEATIKAEELEAQLEELHDKDRTEAEKLQRAFEREQKKREKLEQQFRDQQAAAAKAMRESSISSIASSIEFADEKARQAGRILLEHNLNGVDDLTDTATVEAIVGQFRETVPHLLKASGTGGNGSTPTQAAGVQPQSTKWTRASVESLANSDPSAFEQAWPEIQAAMASGDLT